MLRGRKTSLGTAECGNDYESLPIRKEVKHLKEYFWILSNKISFLK